MKKMFPVCSIYHDRILKIIVLFLLLSPLSIAYGNPLNLTAGEQEFIRLHPIIKVATDRNWPPFDFSKNNTSMGFSISYLNKISKLIGIDFEFVQGDWNKVLEMIKEKKVDMVSGFPKGTQHEEIVVYTRPYLNIFDGIFVRKDSPPLRNYKDLFKKTVAVVRGYDYQKIIAKHYPQISIYLVDTPLEGILAVSQGEIDAYLDNSAVVNFYLTSHFITNIVYHGRPGFPEVKEYADYLFIAVRADYPLLRDIIDKAIAAYPEEDKLLLSRMWLGNLTYDRDQNSLTNAATYDNTQEPKSSPGMIIRSKLTDDQLRFLDSHPVVRVASQQDWPPYDFIEDGKPAGFAIDHIKLMAKHLGLTLKFVNGYTWSQLLALFEGLPT